MGGVDLNLMEHFSEIFRGDAHEHRQDPVRPTHGLPAMDHFHSDRRWILKSSATREVMEESFGRCFVAEALSGR